MAFNFSVKVEDITAMPGADKPGQVTMTIPRLGRAKKIRVRLANSANTTFNMTSITRIQAKLGGGIQRRASGVRWDAINALNGAQYGSQAFGTLGTDYERCFTIYLEEPWRNRIRMNSIDPNALGWNTLWTGTNKPLQVILDVAALGAGVTPNISAEVDFDDGDNGKDNAIIKWEEDDYNVNSGLMSIANVDNGLRAGEGLVQVSVFNNVDSVPTQVRLEWGKSVIANDRSIRSINAELISAGMSPAAATAANLSGTAFAARDALHLVFDRNDALDDALAVGVANSLLKVNYTGGVTGTVPVIRQVLGLPNKS